jgi:hypothetical protein
MTDFWFFSRKFPSLLISRMSPFVAAGFVFVCGIGSGHIAIAASNILAQSSPEETSETPEPESEQESEVPDTEDSDQTQQPTESTTESQSRFTCEMAEDEYTVMYHPQSQPDQSYAWAVPSALGGGWTPQKRCEEISRRLEAYRPDGLLELRTSVENNYDIICVTTENIPECRIVLTVPPGQDPELTRDLVFENLTQADRGVETEPVNTVIPENDDVEGFLEDVLDRDELDNPEIDPEATTSVRGINLKPFLDPADGGTGIRLTGGNSSEDNPQLSPEQFR